MIPKEKAEELVVKYSPFVSGNSQTLLNKKLSIRCAIVEVVDIIELDVIWYDEEFVNCKPEQTLEFWEEVLNELKFMSK